MSKDLIYDSLGEPLNEGDLILLNNNVYTIASIYSPQIETNISLVEKPKVSVPRIVGVRILSDLTVTGEYGKRLRQIWKCAAKLKPSSETPS
jgi:hypothetical protein